MKAFLARLCGKVVAGRCPACGAVTAATGKDGQWERPADLPDAGLCPSCAQALTLRRRGFCPGCAAFAKAQDMPVTLCGACRLKPRAWSAVGCFGSYEGLLRDLVLKFKFGSAMAGVALLREMAWRTYAFHRERADGFSGNPDVVTAVPLYRNRLRGRGYNQSLELAKGVAAKLGVRAFPGALRKVRRTSPQNELSATERRTNLKDAFVADERMVAGKNVLVVDDVMTTGSTLEEAARVLLRAGACRVEVLALARD